MVAGVIPWTILRPSGTSGVGVRAGVVLSAGLLLLLWCVREFYVSGKGTLAPWSPPRHLVTTGPYRFSRHALYVAVMLILTGWAAAFESQSMWIYTVGVALAFHVRIVRFEEPWLAGRYGDDFEAYCRRVPRWLVRWPAA